MKKLNLYHSGLILLFLALASVPLNGQITRTWTGLLDNNWSNLGNWLPITPPLSILDPVIIPAGSAVNVDIAAVCANITMEGGTNSSSIILLAGQSLTVAGAVSLEAPTADGVANQIAVNAGTFSCASLDMADTAADSRDVNLLISTGTASVTGSLTMNGAATENSITFSGAGTLNIGGDLNAGGNLVEATGTVNYNGSTAQSVRADTYYNLGFSGGGAKTLAGVATISNACTFASGIVSATASNYLLFNDDTTVSGAVDASHVAGPVRKIGNDAFVFPIGRSGNYAPLSISAPGDAADSFEAEYFDSSPTDREDLAVGDGLDHVSDLEFWELDRLVGTSNVSVTLSWRDDSAVTDPSTLRVGRYDGDQWRNEGNTATTGDASSGTITSDVVTSFSPFTLASTLGGAVNPLPVQLGRFEGNMTKNGVLLQWETLMEENNAYFELASSENGKDFRLLAALEGKGNSHHLQRYEYLDDAPLAGIRYYQLRQFDFDGTSEDFPIISVAGYNQIHPQVNVYPNPTKELVQVEVGYSKPTDLQLQVIALNGQVVAQQSYKAPKGSSTWQLPLPALAEGLYHLKILEGQRALLLPLMISK